MTLHVISPRLFYEEKLPPLSLKTVVIEPFKEGKRHLFAYSPISCQASIKRHIFHKLVGGLLYIPVINSLVYLILRKAAQDQKPLAPTLYQNKEGLIYWHIEDFSWKIMCSNDPSYKDILNSMKLLEGAEYEKELSDLKWRMQIEEAINLNSKSTFKKLLEVGKQKGILDKLFSNCATYYSSLIHKISKIDETKKFIPLAYEAGVDFAKKDTNFENTGLIWAIANASNSAAMKILKTAGEGPYINQKGWGNTALHLAVGKGYEKKTFDGEKLKYSNLDLVKELIAKKADVNLQNEDGNTPLHLACLRRDPEMVRVLLEAGANPRIRNEQNYIPSVMLFAKYDQAHEILENTVKYFHIDKKNFEANKEKILPIFQELFRTGALTEEDLKIS